MKTATVEHKTVLEPITPELWAEIQPLFRKHYDEIATFKDIPMTPSYQAYEAASKANNLRCFNVRTVEGELIGYAWYFLAPSLHYWPNLYATEDILYLLPEYRGSGIAIKLLEHTHTQLKAEGVKVVMLHTKVKEGQNFGPMLKRKFGYELIDEVWGLRLDKV